MDKVEPMTWFRVMSDGIDWLSGGTFRGCSPGAHGLFLATVASTVLILAAGVVYWRWAFGKGKASTRSAAMKKKNRNSRSFESDDL